MAAKFEQIKTYILEKIECGAWRENDPVPSENKLATQFGVSRMTARRALDELSQQSILIRTKGSGTYVASLKSQGSMFEIRDIADEIQARGHDYSATIIKLDRVDAEPAVAISLDIPVASKIHHSIIVHNENSKPVQFEERFVNPQLAPNYLEQDYEQCSAHEYLSKVAPLTEARHTIEAIAAPQFVAEHLQLLPDEPCLQLLRLTSSKQGIVCFARIIYPGARYQLSGHLTFKK